MRFLSLFTPTEFRAKLRACSHIVSDCLSFSLTFLYDLKESWITSNYLLFERVTPFLKPVTLVEYHSWHLR